MNSKYRTRCRECGNTINVGDEIEKRDGQWVHAECPSADRPALTLEQALGQESAVENSETHYEAPTAFVPSAYQLKVFDFAVNGKGNGVIEAVAGSGKTTTLVELLKLLPPQKRIVYLAFNKHIATELRRRAPSFVEVLTIHALGYRLCRQLNYHLEIDEDKVSHLMDDFWPISRGISREVKVANRMKRQTMRRLVSLAKSTLFDYHDAQVVVDNAERYDIELNEDADEVIARLPDMMSRCIEQDETIDFDDMVWFPLVHPRLQNHIMPYDFLLVDEAQDLNASQIEFVMKSRSHDGRIIAVGDRHQSLYGFRGADVEAIPRLIKMLDATVLPLSISYRCPVNIVKHAQSMVPEIEPSPTAKAGEIKFIEERNLTEQLNDGDMVICRTNAPLVAPAFEMIRRGKKATIRGQDIGRNIVAFIERFDAADLHSLEISMNEYTVKEYQRLLDKGKELQAEMLMDKMNTILATASHSSSVDDLVNKLLTLFSDKNDGVVFSSIHRAKGLEADHVYIMHPELIPHPKAKQGWQREQEENCHYVAVTRSKDILYYVRSM